MRTIINVSSNLLSTLKAIRDERYAKEFRQMYGSDDLRIITELVSKVENASRLRMLDMEPQIILDKITANALGNFMDYLSGD